MSEATAACLFMMVQGNILAVTGSHWLIAAETGAIAGAIATLVDAALGDSRRWLVALVLTAFTTAADFIVHDGPIASVLLEAVLTGIGAGALSLAFGALIGRWRAKRGAAKPASS